MVQLIGLRREGEGGDQITNFVWEGLPLQVLDLAPPDSVCVRFIDPYGETVFNQLQLPVLIEELEAIHRRSSDASFREHLGAVLKFLSASRDLHTYVRFSGD